MSKRFFKLSFLLLLTCFFSVPANSEDDPNPDSPTPVLLSQTGSSQILAVDGASWKGNLPRTSQTLFRPSPKSVVTLFVTNLDLMESEGANSLRVYLYQKSGKTFELQSQELSQVNKTVYALKVRLYDPNGYRGQPAADGESIIYLSWRGLVSNPLKIYLGRTGGEIKTPEFLKQTATKPDESDADAVGYRWSGDRARFFEQATFGATTELDNRVRRIGLRTWLTEQFETLYPTNPYPDIPLMPTNVPTTCSAAQNPTCFRDRYTMQPVQQWFFKEAFYGGAPLRHRISWALSQIWVTSGISIQQSSHMIAYHRILSNNAFGNYRSLMREATLNATMGDYLDMARSTRTNPNENYPREILQLFTIGLFMLNPDGTQQRDGQGNPVPTYNQETINNFSKVFTGWTFCQNQAVCPSAAAGTINFKDPMLLNASNHDTTAKTLLNYPNAVNPAIPACPDCTTEEATKNYADSSLNAALDNIFNHPNLPPFVSRLLIQQLVTSDPSLAYVERVANVFVNNGQNVRGDMKSVIRAILLDPEARGNVKTAPRYGKLREPVQILTNLGRLFPAKSWDGNSLSDGGFTFYMEKTGQNPFYSPTVFNYFPPDYIVPGTTLNAPEFALMNTTSAINRTNFVSVLVFEGITPNITDSLRGTSLDYSEAMTFAAADTSGNQLLDYLNTKMMHGVLSAEQRAAILTAVTTVPSSNPLLRTKTAIYLLASSSQYQVQR
ncbi:MAG TPA: DUF1800 family protein [Pyrinomonadaceae bacterium]|jgi:uncharacterized protein (DUF1800 family)